MESLAALPDVACRRQFLQLSSTPFPSSLHEGGRPGRNTNSFLISFHLRRQSIVGRGVENGPPLLLSAKYKQNRKKYRGGEGVLIVTSECMHIRQRTDARKEGAGQSKEWIGWMDAFSLFSVLSLGSPAASTSASLSSDIGLPSFLPFSCP